MQIVVEEENIRIDKYLASNTDFSRSLIGKMLEDKAILLNGKSVKASHKVSLNDVIDIDDNYVKDDYIEPNKMDLNIVYEDNDIIVINKPSGVVVHPGCGNKNNTLVNGLKYYTTNLSDTNGEERPGIVHRIDKDTSGLLLVAKTNIAHEVLANQFKNKEVKREYLALIKGVFPHNSATIDAPIGRDKLDRKKMTVTSENSKKAITHLKVIKRYKKYTLVSLILDTGRTHQIRVHMKYIGYPIYNDPVYTNDVTTPFGQFLHSYKMDFNHPITKEKMHFECPLPSEFQEFIDSLEQD